MNWLCLRMGTTTEARDASTSRVEPHWVTGTVWQVGNLFLRCFHLRFFFYRHCHFTNSLFPHHQCHCHTQQPRRVNNNCSPPLHHQLERVPMAHPRLGHRCHTASRTTATTTVVPSDVVTDSSVARDRDMSDVSQAQVLFFFFVLFYFTNDFLLIVCM